MAKAQWLASLFEGEASEKRQSEITEELQEFAKLKPVDFQYSTLAIALQNFSGACWFVGIAIPLLAALGWT